MRRAYFYALLALCLFAMSLLLPALETSFLGASVVLSGWRAAFYGISAAWESFQSLVGGADKVSWKFILAGLSATFNVVFFLSPMVVRNLHSSRARLIAAGICSGIGFALGVFTSFAFADMKIILQPGFYLWLLGYVVNVYAVSLALYESLRSD